MEEKKIPGKVLTPEECDELAKTELNEDPRRREADIKHIRDWLQKQPHLAKTSRQDDKFILFFLRGCKFSLEKTKEKLENWHTLRGLCPEFFDNWDPTEKEAIEIMKYGPTVVLPGYDKHGRKVILQRMNLVDPSKYKPEYIQKVVFMIMEAFGQTFEPQTTVCGVVVISDSVGVTMTHMKNFSPGLMKKIITVYEEAFPDRPKALHLLNMPGFIDGLFTMLKSFMKEKMRERIVLHPMGDLKKLQEALGTEVLPEEYGGTNGTVQEHIDFTIKQVTEHRDWLMKMPKFKSNESKRIGLPKTHSEIFGMVGSFRQLSID